MISFLYSQSHDMRFILTSRLAVIPNIDLNSRVKVPIILVQKHERPPILSGPDKNNPIHAPNIHQLREIKFIVDVPGRSPNLQYTAHILCQVSIQPVRPTAPLRLSIVALPAPVLLLAVVYSCLVDLGVQGHR